MNLKCTLCRFRQPFHNLFLVFFFLTCKGFSQGNCNNVGFEDGTTSNWVCGSGTYGVKSPTSCTQKFPINITTTGCLDGSKDNPLSPANTATCRHSIMTSASGTDINSNNVVPCLAPGNLFPSGTNSYSFRIGNAVGSADATNGSELAYAENIKYSMKVSTDNAGLTYMYAAFLNANGHRENEAPRFEIKVTHLVNGKEELITCGYYQVVANATNPDFIQGAKTSDGYWYYTKWKKVAMDLSNYIGEMVTVEFTTADCYPTKGMSINNNNGKIDTVCNGWGAGSHSAYAYIDLYCTKVEIPSPVICANKPSVEICAPPGYISYQWPSGQPGIQPPLDKQCVTIKNPKAGDVYTVNMISSAVGNCKSTAKLTLQGNDFKINDTAVCIGSKPFKLNAVTNNTGKFTWKWEPQKNLDRYDVPNPTFDSTLTPGTTTYTVTMIDEVLSNCNQVKTVKVTVGASFTVKTSDVTICEGETATLNASGADDYTWQPGGATGATITVTPTSTITYTVTGKSNTATCPGDDKSEATVTVKLKPVVDVKDITICKGDTAKLNGSVTQGGSTGSWTGGTGVFIPNRSVLNAGYIPSSAEITAGSVQLTLESEDPAGPCPSVSKVMTLTIVPPVTADAGKDDTICEGSTVTLAAKFGGAATGGKWSGGTGTFSPDANSPEAVYTPGAADITAGKVTLTFSATNASNASCPGGKDEMTIFINKKPVVDAGPMQTICFGTFATLAGSISGGATSATWSGGTGTFQPNNKSLTPKYTPSGTEMSAGKVTLTLTTNASGKCPAASDTTSVIINPLATIDAGAHQVTCVGTPVQLAGIVGGGAISGTWTGGSGTYSPNNQTANAIYTPTAAEEKSGKIILTFTSNDPPGPCPAVSDTMSISIDQLPVAIAGDVRSICAGELIKLNGKVTGAASSGTWSGGQGIFSKNNNDLTGTYKPTPQEIAAGKVTLILTTKKVGLCPVDIDSVTHLINAVPVVKFAVDTPKACPPHCVSFFDSSSVTGGTLTKWLWNFGIDSSKIKNPKGICFEKPGKYDVSLTVISDKQCKATLKKDVYIETYSKPHAAFTANPWQVNLYDPTIQFLDQSSSDVVMWTWDLGDGKIISPKTKNPLHKYEVNLPYKYIVKLFVMNDHGCVDSVSHPVEVLPEFTFYIPNAFTPTRTDGTNDTFFGKGVGIVDYHIWIFDRWGNMIFDTTDMGHGWDGRAHNGADVAQQDVYVWKVLLKDIFGKRHEYIGTVTLVK